MGLDSFDPVEICTQCFQPTLWPTQFRRDSEHLQKHHKAYVAHLWNIFLRSYHLRDSQQPYCLPCPTTHGVHDRFRKGFNGGIVERISVGFLPFIHLRVDDRSTRAVLFEHVQMLF